MINNADDINLPAHYPSLHWAERRMIREEYVRRQNGDCAHCGASLFGPPAENLRKMRVNRRLFPKNFFKYPVHLHHCHKTGMTIGAVHNKCNAVLWQYHGE